MTTRIRKQGGFSHIEVVVVVIVIALIATVGWWVMQRSNTKTSQKTKSSSSNSVTDEKSKSTTEQAKTASTVKLDTVISDINSAFDNESTVEQSNSDSYQSRASNDTTALKTLGETYNESSF